jgi:hypothetical protein
MTIQPTSSCSSHASEYTAPQKPPAAKSSQELPQDTVQLSSKAKASSGDVDHDGDSH